ncbi:MAG: hypothetical protein ACRBN8_09690 [Nannocystales bacterium]
MQTDADDKVQRSAQVLLVTTAGGDESGLGVRVRRTRAELEAAGFDVLEVGLTAEIQSIGDARIAGLADEYSCRALLLMHPSKAQADLWSVSDDAVPRRRAVVVGDAVASEGESVFAVRAAEVLQATLLEVEEHERPTPPPPEQAPKSQPLPTPPPAPAPRWGLRLGAHLGGAGRDLGVLLGPSAGATIALGPRRRLALDIDAWATGLTGRLAAREGDARVGFGVMRGTVGWWPVPTHRVSPGFGLGWGGLVAWTQGHGRDGFRGRTDVTVVGTPVASADVAFLVTPRFRIRLGTRVGVALPAIQLLTASGPTRAAQPLLDGGVTFELLSGRES